MNYATLWVCPDCSTVVAEDADLDVEPTTCEVCGFAGHFLKPRLAHDSEESVSKELSASGAGPGGRR